MTISYKAAWVPEAEPLDWDTAAELAVAWTEQVADDEGSSAVLVTVGQGAESSVPALQAFGDRHQRTTPLSKNHQDVRGIGPVLAYFPDPATMELAIRLAHKSTLTVIEGSFNLPLRGWARATQAIDLRDPEAGPIPEDPEFAKLIGSLVFQGGKSFADKYGRTRTQQILSDYKRAGGDLADVASAVFADPKISYKAYNKLVELIEKIPGGVGRGYSSRDW